MIWNEAAPLNQPLNVTEEEYSNDAHDTRRLS